MILYKLCILSIFFCKESTNFKQQSTSLIRTNKVLMSMKVFAVLKSSAACTLLNFRAISMSKMMSILLRHTDWSYRNLLWEVVFDASNFWLKLPFSKLNLGTTKNEVTGQTPFKLLWKQAGLDLTERDCCRIIKLAIWIFANKKNAAHE
jgi:hypothetical protein